MSVPRKKVSLIVQKKLFSLSGNQCYFYNCTEKIYDSTEDVITGIICHITAVSPGGPRYIEIPQKEINSHKNLILLCPKHHKIIDTNSSQYDESLLKKMKSEHESFFSAYNETYAGEANFKNAYKANSEELIILSKAFDSKQIPNYTKKNYPVVPNYIKRNVIPVRKADENSDINLPLTNLLLEKNRMTVLGVAGSGKSVELDNLAHLFSSQQDGLYPIKIRLNTLTNQSIEDLLSFEYSDFNKIPEEKLLIILDALDEVHSDFIDIVVSKIVILSRKYSKSSIIVSCRNNFYITENEKRTAKIEGFSTYLLEPLNYNDIIQFIHTKIPEQKEALIKELEKHKLIDLLFSPFYLVSLVEYFSDKKTVPNSKKDVFEFLIEKRFSMDIQKYANSGVNIDDYQFKVNYQIEKLAIISECLGRNYLNEKDEFLRIVTEMDLLKVIKRTFLFNKSNSGNWEFEHNNFQEYLAAKYLSNIRFETIQKFISFAPDHKKIKPSWLNTLSFLYSILDNKDERLNKLNKWIIDVEPDVLVRFEKDKIDLSIRENIFKSIYENLQNKKLIIRNEKFESEDLARFVSESKSIIEYLMEKAIEGNDLLKVSESIRLFKYFDNIDAYKKQIQEILTLKICDSNASKEVKHICLYTLASLNISNKELTEKILSSNELDSNQYFRAGFYKYIKSSNHYEDYIDLYIKGIAYIEEVGVTVNGNKKNKTINLADEKFNFEKLIAEIKSPDAIQSILRWFLNIQPTSFNSFYFGIVRLMLKNAKNAYKQGQVSILDDVFSLTMLFSRRYGTELKHELRNFFSDTDTTLIILKKLLLLFQNVLEGEKYQYSLAIAIVSDINSINFLLDEITSKHISENEIYWLRNLLSRDAEKEVSDYFYKKVNELENNKYLYVTIDHEAERIKKKKKDIELLFDKNLFLAKSIEIFNKEGKLKLTFDELFDYKKAHFNNENTENEIILDYLRDYARKNSFVELKDVESLVNIKEEWTWFVVKTLVLYDSHDKIFEFELKEKNYIKEWINNNLPFTNFETTVTKISDKNYHYRYLELFIAYFTERMNIDVNDSVYLDFLYIDCHLLPSKLKETEDQNEDITISGFVLEKVGLQKVRERITQNLRKNELVDLVKFRHYSFCKKNNIQECVEFLLCDILSGKFDNHETSELIEYYLYLKGDVTKIELSLDQFDQNLKLKALKILEKYKSNFIKDYCKKELTIITDEELKLKYIELLLKIDNSDTLVYLKEWILKNKKIPYRSDSLENLSINHLSDLMDITEDAIENNYGVGNWDSRDEFLSHIISLGSKNDGSYRLTRDNFLFWISKFPKEASKLHYLLQKMDSMYYSQKPQALSFNEAIKLIKDSDQFAA